MKNFILYIFVFLLAFSCYKDPDFVDISQFDVFMIEVTLFYDTILSSESYDYDLIYHHTDSFGQIINFQSGFIGSVLSNNETRFRAVHEYKKVGVTIKPVKNIISYNVKIRELNNAYPDNLPIVNIENIISEEVSIMYNFDTEELEIN